MAGRRMTPDTSRPRRLQAQPSFSSRLALHESARPMIARTMAEVPREFSAEALTAAYDAWLDGTARATIRDGIATIPVRNVLTKDWSWWNYYLGWSSYDQIAHDLEVAIASPEVRGILLSIDSPGGMVDGCAELGERIMAARDSGKPLVVHVDGMAASAAYWIASAASRITLAPTAMVGSIGTVMTFTDWSKYEQALGVATIEIVSTQSPKKRPNPAEAAGKAQLQVHVDALAEVFLNAVAAQRAVSVEVVKRDFGQGDVFVGQRALDAGLADALGTYDATHRALVEETSAIAVQIPFALGLSGNSAAIAEHVTAALAAAFPHQEDSMARTEPANRPAAADPVEEDDTTPPPNEPAEETPPASTAADDPEQEPTDEEVTALATQHARVVARIRTEAAAAERTRIAAISALGRPGQEAVLQACIADGVTVADAALRLVQHERTAGQSHLRGVASEEQTLQKPDNSAVPTPAGDAGMGSSIAALFHEHNPKRRPTAAGRA